MHCIHIQLLQAPNNLRLLVLRIHTKRIHPPPHPTPKKNTVTYIESHVKVITGTNLTGPLDVNLPEENLVVFLWFKHTENPTVLHITGNTGTQVTLHPDAIVEKIWRIICIVIQNDFRLRHLTNALSGLFKRGN